jgi:hypothetical protein
MNAFAKLFPYFSLGQIRHLIDKLKKEGVLLTANFNKTGYDRTQWYSVCDECMALYLGEPYRSAAASHEEHSETADDLDDEISTSSMCPGGQVDVQDVTHAFAPKGTSMCNFQQMDLQHITHPPAESCTPIPDVNTVEEPAATVESTGDPPLADIVREKAAAALLKKQELKEHLKALNFKADIRELYLGLKAHTDSQSAETETLPRVRKEWK